MQVHFLSLQLVCFWGLLLESDLFLEAQACELSTLVTSLALISLCWAFESFNMLVITTFSTSIFACMSLLKIKFFLVLWSLLLTCVPHVTLWSWLEGFILVFAWWKVCWLMSHQIDLSSFGITCYLLDMSCSHLGCFCLICKLSDFACREPVKDHIIDDFVFKLFISQEKPKYITVQTVCGFLWILSKINFSLFSLVPFIYRSVSLMKSCKEIKPCLNFIRLWLAKFLKFSPDCIQGYFCSWKAPGDILVHSKMTTPGYNFLALLRIGEHCKVAI